jgi:hypothetical protein
LAVKLGFIGGAAAIVMPKLIALINLLPGIIL